MNLGEYSCRPLQQEDLRQVLEWRNSPFVHERMLTDHKITWEEHCAWFDRIKGESPSEHLVFTKGGTPLGYIAFFGHDEAQKRCSLGIYLGSPSATPMDGIYLLTAAIQYAFDNLGIDCLQAETLLDNEPSLQLARFLGFQDVRIEPEYCQKNGQAMGVQIMQLTRENWQSYCEERGSI